MMQDRGPQPSSQQHQGATSSNSNSEQNMQPFNIRSSLPHALALCHTNNKYYCQTHVDGVRSRAAFAVLSSNNLQHNLPPSTHHAASPASMFNNSDNNDSWSSRGNVDQDLRSQNSSSVGPNISNVNDGDQENPPPSTLQSSSPASMLTNSDNNDSSSRRSNDDQDLRFQNSSSVGPNISNVNDGDQENPPPSTFQSSSPAAMFNNSDNKDDSSSSRGNVDQDLRSQNSSSVGPNISNVNDCDQENLPPSTHHSASPASMFTNSDNNDSSSSRGNVDQDLRFQNSSSVGPNISNVNDGDQENPPPSTLQSSSPAAMFNNSDNNDD